MAVDPTTFRVCSTCRQPIGFSQRYYRCSVSSCNRGRTALYFCTLDCFTAHVPVLRHRDAWAEEERAPTREQWQAQLAAEEASMDQTLPSAAEGALGAVMRAKPTPNEPRENVPAASKTARPDEPRAMAPPASRLARPNEPAASATALPRDVLVVVSKLKAYVRARSELNTSDGVVDVLSDHLRAVCDEAIREAGREGRKTVLDRDVQAVLRRGWRVPG